jgi:hypothetical protein
MLPCVAWISAATFGRPKGRMRSFARTRKHVFRFERFGQVDLTLLQAAVIVRLF